MKSGFFSLVTSCVLLFGRCSDPSNAHQALLTLLNGSPSDSVVSESEGGPPDNYPPQVASTTPGNSYLHVATNSEVKISFTKDVQESTVIVNTTNTTCSGSIRISSDNFATCLQMAPAVKTNARAYSFKPSVSFAEDVEYQVKVAEVKDGKGLFVNPYIFKFQTASYAGKSFITSYPTTLKRSQVTTSMSSGYIELEFTPTVSTRHIREIVLTFEFAGNPGSYHNSMTWDKYYPVNNPSTKRIELYYALFGNPNFTQLASWQGSKKLKIHAAILYSDGSHANTAQHSDPIEITLENNLPDSEGFLYYTGIDFDLTGIEPKNNELPKDQWQVWLEKTKDDVIVETPKKFLGEQYGDYGFLPYGDFVNYYSIEESNQVFSKILIDSTGDGQADYTKTIPDYGNLIVGGHNFIYIAPFFYTEEGEHYFYEISCLLLEVVE